MSKIIRKQINLVDPKIAGVVKKKLEEAEQINKIVILKKRNSNEATVDNIGHSEAENWLLNSSTKYNKEPSRD